MNMKTMAMNETGDLNSKLAGTPGLKARWGRNSRPAAAEAGYQPGNLPNRTRRGAVVLVALWAALLAAILMAGCASFETAVNTKDVTKITVTTTGLRIGMGTYPQTPELTVARHQVEYYKIPTGLNSTNSQNAADVAYVPSLSGSYEAGAKSALFGDATVTTTIGVGDAGVGTIIGGQHVPINAGAGAADASNSKLYSSPLTFGPSPAPVASSQSTNGIPVPKN
jgi:hypothetical protein